LLPWLAVGSKQQRCGCDLLAGAVPGYVYVQTKSSAGRKVKHSAAQYFAVGCLVELWILPDVTRSD